MDAAARADETRWLRTEKSRGPDAPTLASSCGEYSLRRRWQKSPVTEESAKETVKTIAQGMPGSLPVYLWRLTRVLSTFAHGAMGAAGTRHSLRPLSSRDSGQASLGHFVLRERRLVSVRHRPARPGDPVFRGMAMRSRAHGVLDTPHARGMTLYLLFEN
jgi:hypothetical protein